MLAASISHFDPKQTFLGSINILYTPQPQAATELAVSLVKHSMLKALDNRNISQAVGTWQRHDARVKSRSHIWAGISLLF